MAGGREESNFAFVHDRVLRGNLDRFFDHILELLLLLEAHGYGPLLQSSFRQTIIIYTASIIEALLMYTLTRRKTEADCARIKTEHKIIREIYRIDETQHIVLLEDVAVTDDVIFSKINLDQVNKFCKQFGLIDGPLFEKIDRVRKLRNKQHLGSLQVVDSDYSKADLEFVFSVAREVKRIAQTV